jgi:hypothetical protein
MRKFFTGGLVMMAGMVSIPVALVPSPAAHSVPTPDYRQDPRLQSLRRFFAQFDCPAHDYAHFFLEAADDYKLDWRLLPSLSWVESTGGKLARNNNLFGWNSGRAHFSSPRAAIHTVGYRLAHSSPYKDKPLDGVLATYNHDPAYATRVKAVMRRIAPTE